MFTGLIETVGSLCAVDNLGQERRLRVRCGFDMQGVAVGDSIAVNGVCLTVTEKGGSKQQADTFAVHASAETLQRTTLARLTVGAAVNLERALSYGGRLHGHLVQGHVDGIGHIERLAPHGRSLAIWVRVPTTMGRYIIEKGSIAIDGVSLTVNTLADNLDATRFSVNIIPHTQQQTTLANLVPGREVNIETDLLGRTVERLLKQGIARDSKVDRGIDAEYLREKGFLP